MNNNVLVMNEDEMNAVVGTTQRCHTNIEQTTKNMPTKFSSIKNTGLFNNGLTKINQKLNSITTTMYNVQNIVKERSGAMFDMDRAMAKKAEQLEMPQDFVKNDSMQFNTFHETLLDKVDGKSVNNGQGLQTIKEIADNSIAAQALGDISKDSVTKEEKLDTSTNISAKKIADINNENGVNEQTLDTASSIVQKNLRDINTSQDNSTKAIDESTSITSKVLKDISNVKNLAKQEIADNFATTENTSVSSNPTLDMAASIFKDDNKLTESHNIETVGTKFRDKVVDIADDVAESLSNKG